MKPRWHIGISTTDEDLIELSTELKKSGFTYEDIYRAGVNKIIEDQNKKLDNL